MNYRLVKSELRGEEARDTNLCDPYALSNKNY